MYPASPGIWSEDAPYGKGNRFLSSVRLHLDCVGLVKHSTTEASHLHSCSYLHRSHSLEEAQTQVQERPMGKWLMWGIGPCPELL